ncbi:MAG: MaoC family dehydratase [Saprospiraceae bacterium]|nr:MaoC family dehydratase [Saprospiraceae bacterium]
MNLGDKYQYTFSFTQTQVNAFAQVTGDDNPLHLDDAYAAATFFKKPIIHGFLGGSIFSKVFGTLWPGEGTIYLKQNLEFKRPMYVEESYTANFEVIAFDNRRRWATIRTTIVNDKGKVIIAGEAVIQYQT